MEILLATGNAHKRDEIAAILPAHTIVTPPEVGISFDFEETGTTFIDNALGKAPHLHRLSGGKPVLADDSGLCIRALQGAPGVYSARFGSQPGEEPLETSARNRLLLDTLGNALDRKAFFVCAMVLVLDEYRHYIVQETVEGEITQKGSGSGGFGYDPLFYLPEKGMTMAELPGEEKNRISHRGKAGAAMAVLINELKSL